MLLSVSGLHTHFNLGSHTVAKAVDGISFEVDEGETLALVGESGCGKSVTAFSIMRLLPENAVHPGGDIRFGGRSLLDRDEAEMRALRGNQMAMIFQEPMTSLNPLMRVGRQLTEPLELHRGMGTREAKREALDLMHLVGIPAPEDRLRDFPHQFSGGMRQRMMIAMALACRPKLLIADEPTTALDVTIQAQILNLIRDLQAETGMAVLFITHDLGVVNQIADRVCVMYAGRIMEHGTRPQVFEGRSHPYARGLFASLPSSKAKCRRLQTIPGLVPSATDYPAGCPFHERCRECFDPCAAEVPAAHLVGAGHTAACHLFAPGAGRVRDEHVWEVTTSPSPDEAPAEVPQALLSVSDLRTFFPIKRGVLLRTVAHVKAVDGVTFDIASGSTLALVGESGCGKTTVGYSLLRLLREARGRVIFNSRDVMAWDGPELQTMRRHLQIVFQDPFAALSPRLTVGRAVEEGLSVHEPELSREQRAARVTQALAEVGLDESARDRYPHEFSGGQRQRVSIARALVLQPEFLVLDEPTSALDVSVQAKILNLLLDLQERHGLTYLFITHDLAVVEHMAAAVAVMYLGRIVEHADARSLFASPRHPYTRSLLRAVPRAHERQQLARLIGEVPSPLDPPSGCHFHPRCPVLQAAAADSPLRCQCPVAYPELVDDGGHRTACHAVGTPADVTHPPSSERCNAPPA